MSMFTTTEEADTVFGSLACACALGQAGERNRSGLKKTSTAAVLSVLSHVLDHHSRYKVSGWATHIDGAVAFVARIGR